MIFYNETITKSFLSTPFVNRMTLKEHLCFSNNRRSRRSRLHHSQSTSCFFIESLEFRRPGGEAFECFECFECFVVNLCILCFLWFPRLFRDFRAFSWLESNHQGFKYTSFPRATTSASSIRTHHNAAGLFPQLFDTAISFVVAL